MQLLFLPCPQTPPLAAPWMGIARPRVMFLLDDLSQSGRPNQWALNYCSAPGPHRFTPVVQGKQLFSILPTSRGAWSKSCWARGGMLPKTAQHPSICRSHRWQPLTTRELALWGSTQDSPTDTGPASQINRSRKGGARRAQRESPQAGGGVLPQTIAGRSISGLCTPQMAAAHPRRASAGVTIQKSADATSVG